jgi:hypothetical protein
MIVIAECDNHRILAIVMHGETRTRPNATEKGKGFEQWIRKVANPMQTFNP